MVCLVWIEMQVLPDLAEDAITANKHRSKARNFPAQVNVHICTYMYLYLTMCTWPYVYMYIMYIVHVYNYIRNY